MKLEVLTIGTELVLGHTLDTNAADIARALAAAGGEVVRHTSVPDRPPAIRAALAEALERTGFVIATGGLGPTRDDMTKVVAAELFGRPLQLDEAVLRQLEARFRRFGRPMPEVNRSQAQVPQGATVLPNPRGTAPGLWLEDAKGRVVVLLPGVPREMRGLLVEEVLPRFTARLAHDGEPPRVVQSRTIRTTGVPESALAERMGDIEDELTPLTFAYLPGEDGVDLRLTAWSLPPADAAARLDAGERVVRERAGEHVYGVDGQDLAAVVLEALRASRRRLAAAESCTGGLVGARLTAVPGASDVFVGGVVAYDDSVKRTLLDVPADVLQVHGAVSEETVRAMAAGARRRFDVATSVAVTGIAGPTGGTPEKPVGTVWLAASVGDDMRALRRVFPGDRDEIRNRSAQAVLDLLRRQLESR
ncbi:MAG TPA: competence/damage-inducible protein A [Gemmatimonadales bacterium]|nr:competence/damage-inducible protein A [Gemmatimonadales bacterium]